MKYRATPSFKKALARLDRPQKASAKRAFLIFKANPFDPRLRALFYLEQDTVVSIDIGTHRLYRD